MEPQENLVRRQYLVSRAQIEKLNRLSKRTNGSAAEVVRRAIDAYDPDAKHAGEAEAEVALEAMGKALRETREELARLRRRVEQGPPRQVLEQNRQRATAEARAYFESHPEELEAISRIFDAQEGPNGSL